MSPRRKFDLSFDKSRVLSVYLRMISPYTKSCSYTISLRRFFIRKNRRKSTIFSIEFHWTMSKRSIRRRNSRKKIKIKSREDEWRLFLFVFGGVLSLFCRICLFSPSSVKRMKRMKSTHGNSFKRSFGRDVREYGKEGENEKKRSTKFTRFSLANTL